MTEDLVPLRIEFDLSRRGYDKDQVDRYVAAAEIDLRLLAADRDAAMDQAQALARQVELLRGELRAMGERVDRISRTPVDAGGLAERLARMVELAQDEARLITGRARVSAERHVLAARQTAEYADRLARDAYLRRRALDEQAAREILERRATAQAQADELLASARAQADRVSTVREQIAQVLAATEQVLDDENPATALKVA
ncbi:hypothetical protein D5S17_15100 [Pseudonocardiaceae bacterium YIM PH 21723]|nr:hypothetical protein D5S17_15100 [Pseudonocardiaceae bacterium YIM PH 21723]